MKRKQVFLAALLCLSLMLCACGGVSEAATDPISTETRTPEPLHETPAPLSEAAQRAVIDSNRDLWEFPTDPWGERWFYTVTDLLCLINSSINGFFCLFLNGCSDFLSLIFNCLSGIFCLFFNSFGCFLSLFGSGFRNAFLVLIIVTEYRRA